MYLPISIHVHSRFDFMTETSEPHWRRCVQVDKPEKWSADIADATGSKKSTKYICLFGSMKKAVHLYGGRKVSGKDLWFGDDFGKHSFVNFTLIEAEQPSRGDGTACLLSLLQEAKTKGINVAFTGGMNDKSRGLFRKLGLRAIAWAHNDVLTPVFLASEGDRKKAVEIPESGC